MAAARHKPGSPALNAAVIWAGGALLLIGLLAAFLEAGAIERDLKQRARALLMRTGHDWAMPQLAGRDITLTGSAPHHAARLEALNLLYGVWGMRVVIDAVETKALIEPYSFTARRQGGVVAITGYVETAEDRADLMATIKRALPGLEITGGLELGGGQPAGWMRAVRFAATLLQHLEHGAAGLKDRALAIRGAAASADARRALKAALAAGLPHDYRLAREQVTGPSSP